MYTHTHVGLLNFTSSLRSSTEIFRKGALTMEIRLRDPAFTLYRPSHFVINCMSTCVILNTFHSFAKYRIVH